MCVYWFIVGRRDRGGWKEDETLKAYIIIVKRRDKSFLTAH